MYEMKGAFGLSTDCAGNPAGHGGSGRSYPPPRTQVVHIWPGAPAARPHRRAGPGESALRNKRRNPIAPFCVTTYHGFMTTWQTLKRAGYMYPSPSLDAALSGNRHGVVVV